ncbi:transmembrane protein, putative (macronuclear) [Tetrahymena thermophila SB210]|uniref:Transmembrane protein, putative n=1 Tax=Tetrahymena thermophila (strain SB210) TaxID=312017 RepID=I7LVB1_TETTS|nr:transmembrane protein, putative [Tetrahymena thermophila SB210]EAR97588.2 transmembrane protein, putative [Tetrahymena thermophila SB210]|eukprot:XP_001017833.2 transmembrane protein, putative [Tetrahymena thermophila SB210]
MFSKLLLNQYKNLALFKTKIPQLYQKSCFRFCTTHKQQRKIEKEKEEQLVQQIYELETVAQQDQYTEKELQNIISERKVQLESILNEKKLPIEAMLLGLTLTLPVLGGSSYLYYQLAQGIPSESFIPLLNSVTKYIGIHQCFQSGIHWGLAVSQHDLQTDSINSSSEARRLFILSSIPAIGALVNTLSLVYGVPTEGLQNLAPISVMAGLQIFILGLDLKVVNSRYAPLWYMNFKYIIALLCFLSYGLYAAMFLNYGDKVKQLKLSTNDPYRKYIPTNAELLKQKEPEQQKQ